MQSSKAVLALIDFLDLLLLFPGRLPSCFPPQCSLGSAFAHMQMLVKHL